MIEGPLAASVAAVAVACSAGGGIVALLWPRDISLPWLALVGVGGLVGPCALGTGFMALGLVGAGAAAVPLLTGAALVLTGWGVWRRRGTPARPGSAAGAGLACGVALLVLGTTAVSLRTHLGWDGTVVWLHKARVLAASDGVMPAATLADRTRSWSAPDYPLHVPLAMAWVLRWQAAEDERALKALPAAWLAALICLVAAAVAERTAPADGPALRAGAAAAVLATMPRLLIGEGSLTSGYADGPAGALLAAMLWTAWRSNWGADRRWTPLLALLAASLAWTKQEGSVAVAVTAAACGWSQRSWRAALFAVPALSLATLWQVWAGVSGAPLTMAYHVPGGTSWLLRVPVVARAYLTEVAAVGVWGLFWPVIVTVLVWRRPAGSGTYAIVLGAVVLSGAVAFVCSSWPDLAAHLRVTVGRQLIQVVPALLILAFAGVTSARYRQKLP